MRSFDILTDLPNLTPQNGWYMIIVSAITIVVGAFLGGIFTLLNTKYKFSLDEKKYQKLSMKEKVKISYALKKNLREIRLELKADRASICLYHNGETFISGLKIDRFSMHQEDVGPGVELISGHFQGLNVANFPITTYDLLFDKTVICEKIDNCQEDTIRISCSKMSIASFYMFLLETDEEKPLGFITISYSKETVVQRDQMLFVQMYLNKFVRLITDNHTIEDITREKDV